MRIVLSGGGTGGHITPLLAIAKALKAKDPSIELFVIGEDSRMSEHFFKNSVLRRYHIAAGKFRRYPGEPWWKQLIDWRTNLLNVRDALKVAVGFVQSVVWLIKIRPHVVFVKGGYVGLPVGLAAKLLQFKLVLHESDVTAGLANRVLGPLADAIATGFPVEYYPQWHKKLLVFTGNPVRPELLITAKTKPIPFKLQAGLKTILVIGGSSGSRAINEAIVKNVTALTEKYQLIHVVGHRDYARFSSSLKKVSNFRSDRYHYMAFIGPELGSVFRASDLVVSRAGMNSISEIAAFKKPAIIVPHPQLANAHQVKNAEVLAELNAATILPEKRLDDITFEIAAILNDRARLNQLKRNISQFSKLDAATAIAGLILKIKT